MSNIVWTNGRTVGRFAVGRFMYRLWE